MEDWAAQITVQLDEKVKNIGQRDIRFFRVEELKRNIERVGDFSKNCPYCEKEKRNIAEIISEMDVAISVPGKSRREYDRLISRLAGHMQKVHGFFTLFYYTYLVSFLGMVAGLLLGFLLMKLFPAHAFAALSAGFVIGLIVGYFWGVNKDGKIRAQQKLM
jgi:hypothetical protein